ncbi:hypothetical protein Goe27_02420 [Bacillus phage vB_BsuM-Goe27]|nr:hypothetical protein Goe27_02420 [Bacillus phage vB_BsuM-Goe27]
MAKITFIETTQEGYTRFIGRISASKVPELAEEKAERYKKVLSSVRKTQVTYTIEYTKE